MGLVTPAVNWGDPRLPDRFWDLTSPCPVSGCWHWLGYTDSKSGTPKIKLDGREYAARRLAYQAATGLEYDAGARRVVRKCDTDGCCNPVHAGPPLSRLEYSRQYKAKHREELAAYKKLYGRNWRASNKHRARAYTRKWKYGISKADADRMYEIQDGKCAICAEAFNAEDWRRRDVVDHCHSTGEIRELLCNQCNTGLGSFRDRPDYLIAAAAYIAKHGAKQ